MIRLQAATFADAANVREGLASILGGGISVLRRPLYPAPLGAVAVLIVEMSEEAPGQTHRLEILFKSRGNGETLSNFSAEIGTLSGADVDAHGHVPIATLPVILPLQAVEVPREGRYEIEVLGDGVIIGGARIDAVILTDDSSFNPEWY